MSKNEDWWSCPTEAENGNTIIVTGRRDIDKFRNNPRFKIRVEISWDYNPLPSGLPDTPTSEMMQNVTDLLSETFDKDPVAVLTGIYTGDSRREWIFYTLSTHIFGRKLNEALSSLPLLPLNIYCENDPEWNEYQEMRALTEISASDN